MADGDTHSIEGHDVVISGGAVFIDGVQATLNRTDVDVADVLGKFFDHLREESAPEGSRLRRVRDRESEAQDVSTLPELSVVEARPGATIVINIGG